MKSFSVDDITGLSLALAATIPFQRAQHEWSGSGADKMTKLGGLLIVIFTQSVGLLSLECTFHKVKVAAGCFCYKEGV